jgi:hypothetical protein
MFQRKLFPQIWFEGDEPPAGETAFNTFLATIPEEQRANVAKLVEDFHAEKNQALLNTVKATREERDTLANELRDAAKKVEKGSEAETKLLEQANKIDAVSKKASFYEEAVAMQCKNPKVAFALAVTEDLFSKNGAPDWKSIKEKAPELFGVVIPKPKGKGAAGEGTDEVPRKESVNDFIRSRARKGVVTNEE